MMTIVFFPGGPGLSSRTLNQIVVLMGNEPRLLEVNWPLEDNRGGVSVSDYTEMVKITVKQLSQSNDSFLLVGHSYGGVLAADCAVQLQGKVAGLVVIASPISSSLMYNLNAWQRARIRVDHEFGQSWKEYAGSPTTSSYRRLLMSYIPYISSENTVREQLQHMFESDIVCPYATRSCQKHIDSFADLENQLAQLRVPKLSILGENDQLIPLALAKEEYDRLGFKLAVIDGGHFCFLERPLSVSTMLLDLWNRSRGNRLL